MKRDEEGGFQSPLLILILFYAMEIKQFLSIQIVFLIAIARGNAQGVDVLRFLFPEYQDALILYKDGRQFTAPVNFDLLDGYYLFVDNKDKQIKQFANPELISLLRIGSRSFLLGEGETTEVLQAEPLFQVSYSGILRQAPKNITYGGSTQTAAVSTYGGYSGVGVLSSRQQSNNKIVVGISKNYTAKFKGKTKRFNNLKTFLKAIPKNKQAEIKEYTEKKTVDFDNVEQVFELYRYVIDKVE